MDIANETTDAPDGLAQLQTLLRNPDGAAMGRTLGFSLVEVERGRTVFESTPGPHLYNPIGTVHGGFAATLLDSACGCAAHSMLTPTQRYTTLELKVSYHRPLTDKSGVVRAEGKVLSAGRRAAFAEASLTDASGRLCASATSTSTLLILDVDAKPG